jgi:hypothetical protein
MNEEDWRIACDRALLYVRTSPLSSREKIELVAEVLRQAQDRLEQTSGANPTIETLRLLRLRLSRKTDSKVPSLPVNRRGMVSGKLDSVLRLWPSSRKNR